MPNHKPLQWPRELILLTVIYAAYEVTRGVDHATLQTAVRPGRDVLTWERRWDLSPERVLNRALDRWTPLALAASYFHATLHYLVTPSVLIWMYQTRPCSYRIARTTLAVTTGLGLLGFYLVPTAPPRLVPGSGIADR